MQPDFAEAHANLGYLQALQGVRAEAEAEGCYGAALALDPQASALWSNLGVLNLLRQGPGGNWHAAVQEATAALQQLVAAR